MIDPAVIATIAASAVNQKQPDKPVTLGNFVFSFCVVFGLAGLLILGIGALICG